MLTPQLRFGSVCSGIEAASCAWHPLGWQTAFVSEIEPFPCAVLAHRFPDVPNLGDMTKFEEWPDATLDVLVGGTPCQSFSVAGLRKGLADPRGNLMLTFGAIARRYSPRWLVWENVPGVLSSNGGRDFGTFLGMLGELGYGFAYRVLDAQFLGVAQRRRRVFVVGRLGDWRAAAAVLFERHSLSGHPAPSREARKGTAAGTLRSTDGGSDVDHARAGQLIPEIVGQAMSAKWSKGTAGPAGDEHHNLIPVPQVAHALRGEGFDASEDGTGRGTPIIAVHSTQDPDICIDHTHPLGRNSGRENAIAFQTRGSNLDVGEISGTIGTNADRASGSAPCIAFSCKDHGGDAGDISPTLRSMGHDGSHANAGGQVAVAWALGSHAGAADGDQTNRSHASGGPVGSNISEECAYSLRSGRTQSVATPMQVRRLTPRECERLQGFEDDWTLIPWTYYQRMQKLAAKHGTSFEEELRKRGKTLRGPELHDCPDGPRYKALGNSMAVPVMHWIGSRIAQVEQVTKEAA